MFWKGDPMKTTGRQTGWMAWIAAVAVLAGAMAAHAADGTWTNTTSGGLWSGGGNWSGGTVADGASFTADFNTIDITADNTVHLDSSRTLGTLVFGDTDTGTAAGWVLDNDGGANVLTLNGARTLTVNALGTDERVEISADITSDGTVTKTGAGELYLTGDLNYGTTARDLVIDDGTLTVNPPSGNGINANLITINSGGTLRYGGNNSISDSARLDVASGGTLDVNGYSDSIGRLTGAGNITGGGRLYLSGGASVSTFSGTFGGTVAIEINGYFEQDFSGLISNTGQPRINKGTLGVSSASTFGLMNIGSGTDTGTLKYLGTGETCGVPMLLLGTTGGATFDQSGTGLWKLTWGMRNDNGDNQTKTVTLTGSTAGTGEISGPIIYSHQPAERRLSNLVKSGTGTWTLSGTSYYTGTTTVNAGALVVDGATDAASAVTVNSGGTLGGSGTINGSVSIASGGTLLAGSTNNLGTLTLANGLSFTDSGSTNTVRVTGANGAQTNGVVVTGGTVALADAALVIDDTGLTGEVPLPLTIIDNQTAGAISGAFDGLSEGDRVVGTGGSAWYISYVGGTGNDVTIDPRPRGTVVSVR
jgi:autotransporter-associated beta strand protein